MKKKHICFFILLAVAAASCSKNEVKVSGRFVGHNNMSFYLDKITPVGQNPTDTLSTDDNGNFQFKVNLENGQPTLYNIRNGNEIITLLVSPGDRIRLHSLGNLGRNYTVEGSVGSEKLWDLNKILSGGIYRLDSLLGRYTSAGEEEKKEIARSYNEEYYRTKREHIAFIVSDPGSLASLYALYQRMPNEDYLFNGENDIIYYRLVADSTSKIYPDSPYVKALQNEIARAETTLDMVNLLSEKITGGAENYPDLEMTDMYGEKHRLSELEGKVFLLDFWSSTSPGSNLLNAEFKELYEQFSSKGFEIYQVAIDENRSEWVNAVLAQKLPWISVCDFRGASSEAVLKYNISNVPSNFLFDRKGDIINKNIYGEKLAAEIKKLLN